jgi:hypothetical protein
MRSGERVSACRKLLVLEASSWERVFQNLLLLFYFSSVALY